MPFELIIFLLALVPVALRAWMGWRLGATAEMRYVVAFLFAMLVALRYWYQVTVAASDLITIDPRFLAAGIFALLFVVAWMVGALIVNLRGEVYQSVLPNRADNVLGALSGLVSGALLGGSFLVFCAIALPGTLGNFDPLNFPVRLDQLPVGTFRLVEQGIAGVPADSLAHTPLAQVKEDPSDKKLILVWE